MISILTQGLTLMTSVAAQPAAGPATTPPRMRSGYISNADYPRSARVARAEGRVAADVGVDQEGVPTSCRVTTSSGNQALDEQTCRIVTTRMRFHPATQNGRPVPATYIFSIRWQLPR